MTPNQFLGKRLRSVVDGFEGICNGYAQWLTGCDSVSIKGPAKDGKPGEGYWYDVNAVEIVGEGVMVGPAQDGKTGGPGDGVRSPR